MKKISIVVPCYNEEDVISLFLEELHKELNNVKDVNFEIVVVNDGSSDSTLSILHHLQETKYDDLVIVNLSRNFGHESAVSCGLHIASGDAVIPMDADLQDPPAVIPLLIEKYFEGYDVVNAKRADRSKDSFMKRTTAGIFYKIIASWSGKVKVPQNVGHFRLISKRVLEHVNDLSEVSKVFRVQVPYIGYKTTEVTFDRPERAKGVSHYNYKAMTKLALDSIITTTTAPLKYITHVAIFNFLFFILSSVAELTLFILSLNNILLISEVILMGWLIINILLLLSTFIMTSLAIISQYNARAFSEAQHRPFYIVEDIKRKEI